MSAVLETRGLCAAYGPTQVLQSIDIAVEQGGIVTLLGANGAGKTTTLRALCNMMVRISGEIRFNDLMNQLGIEGAADEDRPVHFGGPVDSSRGFVLHSADFRVDQTLVIDDNVALTATRDILQAIVAGYQCGTVYKPIYLEAQAAVALAMYLRAGKTAPHSLLNGTTADVQEHNKAVPSALLTPTWVTGSNIETTVVKDKFVPVSQICKGTFDGSGVSLAAGCAKLHIK